MNTCADTEKAGPEQGGCKEKQAKEEGERVDIWWPTPRLEQKGWEKKLKCQRINNVFFSSKKVDIVQILIPIIQCQRRFILFYFSLLQQAYIQQLESSRIRLAQLEQELHTARAQVWLVTD